MIDPNYPAQVSINVPSSDSSVWVRVIPPDSYLDISITGEGEALEVLVNPRGRQVQVRVGPAAELPGGPPPGSREPRPRTETPGPAGDSALVVEAGDLHFDEAAVQSLSEATAMIQAEEVREIVLEAGRPVSAPAPETDFPAEAPRPVYSDRGGRSSGPRPREVQESLAQLGEPDPPAPKDDPRASTAKVFTLPESPAVDFPEEMTLESINRLGDIAAGPEAGEDFGAGFEEGEPEAAGSSLSLEESLDSDEGAPAGSPEAGSAYEDTNFDEPNSRRIFQQAPQPQRKPPDASTAVIVNYLEDTEDSFFEDQGQSTILPEEEDMDIDLLELGSGGVILPAKPMIPVPRKAL
ncbi:MAG: hypothetical protein LBK52_02900 [Deltaproteobacteria bacterium]|jgi:hypothetical protein|nr:hypothetical protein [Deltaproteobacteria bacterium]